MNELERNDFLPLYPGIISFGITFVRIGLAFLCVPLLRVDHSEFFIVSAIIAIMVFDHYDGKLFKLSSLYEISFWRKWRRILDSCGDRVCIQIVCIPLLFINTHFVLSYLIICFKEILTSTICVLEFRQGIIVYPGRVSKISTVFIGLTAISAIFNSEIFVTITSVILFLTGIMSFISYQRLVGKLNKGLLVEGIDFESI